MNKFTGIIVVFLVCLVACCSKKTETAKKHIEYSIISLAPSITEAVFLMGKGKDLIGKSRFSNFPEGTEKIQEVSDLSNLNLELILNLKPDIALLLPSQQKFKEQLEKINIKTVVIDHRNIESIIDSFSILGRELKAKERADVIIDSIKNIIKMNKVSVNKGKKILISIGRDNNTDITSFYAAGKGTYLSELIGILGYDNILDTEILYPKISAETLIELDPDIIIDLILAGSVEDSKKAWTEFTTVKAVKNREVYIFSSDYATIPGPRTFKFLTELSDSLNSEK